MTQSFYDGKISEFPNNTPGLFALSDRELFDSLGLAELNSSDALPRTHDAGQLDPIYPTDLHGSGLYGSHSNQIPVTRRATDDSLTNMFSFWETDIDSSPGTISEEGFPKNQLANRYNFPMAESLTSEDYVMINNNEQNGLVFAMPQFDGTTTPSPYPAFRQNAAERSRENIPLHQDAFIGSSSLTAYNRQNPQSFEAPGAISNANFMIPGFQDSELCSSWDSINPHSNYYTASSAISSLYSPQSQYNHDPPPWLARSRTWPQRNASRQRLLNKINYTQRNTSQPPFTNPQISATNPVAYEDLFNWTGLGLARTSSPEPEITNSIYHKTSPLAENNQHTIDRYVPIYDNTQSYPPHSNEDMGSARVVRAQHFGSRSSAQNSNRASSITKKGSRNKNSIKRITESRKEHARKVRGIGACIKCRIVKKLCGDDPSVACKKCCVEFGWIVKIYNYLAPAICYRVHFETIFLGYSDCSDLKQRENSIKSAVRSMYGEERDLYLGSGLREYEDQISIDVNPSSVYRVKVQTIRTTLGQDWISTPTPGASMTTQRESTENSYAIIPESLPALDALDHWGRQDIQDLAIKWPLSLELSYDSAFLTYLNVNPRPPCYHIVDATMRIVSLGKNLHSGRPIDHNKIVQMIKNMPPPPSQFGIDEFNDCKAGLQLSMTARMQIYIYAAKEVDKTQLTLGKEIDNLLLNNEGIAEVDLLIIRACLRRLGLEYRQRLQRYQCFDSDEVEDRIKRCRFMYTLYTRLYKVWYRGRLMSICSGWAASEVEKFYPKEKNLIKDFLRLQSLEQAFYIKAPDNTEDLICRSLIAEPA